MRILKTLKTLGKVAACLAVGLVLTAVGGVIGFLVAGPPGAITGVILTGKLIAAVSGGVLTGAGLGLVASVIISEAIDRPDQIKRLAEQKQQMDKLEDQKDTISRNASKISELKTRVQVSDATKQYLNNKLDEAEQSRAALNEETKNLEEKIVNVQEKLNDTTYKIANSVTKFGVLQSNIESKSIEPDEIAEELGANIEGLQRLASCVNH